MKTKKIAITVLGIAIILLSGIILMVYIRNQNKQDYNDLGTLESEEGSNQSNETLHEIDTDLGLEESNYNQVEDETLGFESNSQNNDNTSSDSDLNTSLSTNSNANKNNNTNSNTNKNTNTNSNKNSSSNSMSNKNSNSNSLNNKNPWDELGISEGDYYNKPMWSWLTIEFSINTYGNQSQTLSACIEHGDKQIIEQGGSYKCDHVYSYSGRYLGEHYVFYE